MDKVLNIMKQGFISLVKSDSDPVPKTQVTSNGKPSKATVLNVYGVCSNAPKDSHAFIFNSQAQGSTKFAIVNDFLNRKKNLAEGEVALFNTLTKVFIILKADGSIEANANFKVLGDLDITGDLDVTGDITANKVTASDDVIAGTVSLKNHIHGGVTSGAASTAPPTP